MAAAARNVYMNESAERDDHATSPATVGRTGATPAAVTGRAAPTTNGTTVISRLISADAPITLQQRNPKHSGSGARYELYKHATTMKQLLELGATRADISHDLRT